MSFSEEKDEILKTLRENKITSLWHFTDIRNLPHIRRLDGLRSKEYLEKTKYWRKDIFRGGDALSQNLDQKLGNWDKISLNFKPHTPLAYTKKPKNHFVFIEINPEVAAFEDVYFTDCNAARTRNSQKREKGVKGLSNVNFEMINCPPQPWNDEWTKCVQAEVLVSHHVPIKMFKAIHFISNVSKEYGEFLWEEKCSLFCVNPETFNDIDKYGKGSIQFSYIKEVLISNRDVSKDRVHGIRFSDSYIVEGKPFWVIAYLYVIPGTRISVSLESMRRTIERREEEAPLDEVETPKNKRGSENDRWDMVSEIHCTKEC